jgi:sister chromatid cohesion protein DCC1
MSTQSSTAHTIPFSLSSPQHSFRLLELPDELLQLISAGAPTLRLTSAPAVGAAKGSLAEQLHLCTTDKVWAVRQVSTSNCVYVTQDVPTESGGEEVGSAMDLDGVLSQPTAGVTAIAQLGSVLELIPVQVRVAEVEGRLAALVPLYDGLSTARQTAIAELRKDIPAPEVLLDEALDRLCVCEVRGQAFIPEKTLLLYIWTKIMEGCAISGIKLDGAFDPGMVVAAMVLDDDDYVAYTAIASTLLTQTFPRSGLLQQQSPNERTTLIRLHHQPTTDYLGTLLLMTQLTHQPQTFHDHWRRLLPESWWSLCNIARLEQCALEPDDDRIHWTGLDPRTTSVRVGGLSHDSDTAAGLGPEPKAANATGAGAGAGKRKWHEKFAAQRNAGVTR